MERYHNPRALKAVMAEIEKLGPVMRKFIEINQATLGWELDWIASNLWRYDDVGQASFVRRRIIARYHRNYLKAGVTDLMKLKDKLVHLMDLSMEREGDEICETVVIDVDGGLKANLYAAPQFFSITTEDDDVLVNIYRSHPDVEAKDVELGLGTALASIATAMGVEPEAVILSLLEQLKLLV